MSEKYYKSIDEIPLYNWDKCINGDVKYVRKDVQENTLNEQMFNDVYDDYLKKRGLDKTLNTIFKVMKKKAMLECDYLITRDRFLLTLIEVEEQKLEQLRKPQKGLSLETTLVYLSKWLGFRVNSKDITASEYYAYLDEYMKQN